MMTFWSLGLHGSPTLSCSIGYCSFNGSGCTLPVETLTCKNPAKACSGRGECVTYGDDVTCFCYANASGKLCQFPFLPSNPVTCDIPDACMNGGTCVEDGIDCFCNCPPGFHGNRCEKETRSYTFEENICEHGGTPYRHGHSTGCLCPCGHFGRFCEQGFDEWKRQGVTNPFPEEEPGPGPEEEPGPNPEEEPGPGPEEEPGPGPEEEPGQETICNIIQCDWQCKENFKCELDELCRPSCKFSGYPEDKPSNTTQTVFIAVVVIVCVIVALVVTLLIGRKIMNRRRANALDGIAIQASCNERNQPSTQTYETSVGLQMPSIKPPSYEDVCNLPPSYEETKLPPSYEETLSRDGAW